MNTCRIQRSSLWILPISYKWNRNVSFYVLCAAFGYERKNNQERNEVPKISGPGINATICTTVLAHTPSWPRSSASRGNNNTLACKQWLRVRLGAPVLVNVRDFTIFVRPRAYNYIVWCFRPSERLELYTSLFPSVHAFVNLPHCIYFLCFK